MGERVPTPEDKAAADAIRLLLRGYEASPSDESLAEFAEGAFLAGIETGGLDFCREQVEAMEREADSMDAWEDDDD